MCNFEKLEQVNCQIDVWIDEEEYEKVFVTLTPDPKWGEKVSKAFKHDNCTYAKDKAWLSLFTNDCSLPIRTIKINNIEILDLIDNHDWSIFFSGKLIRAKIQQKGTDCYFQRLDEVVTYLERHLPIISKEKKTKKDSSTKLAVIYLLEMAAAGVNADQRSFSERARRVLQNFINQNETDFINFYDLLARYNIGVHYFHECQYRNAVREFDKIIYDLNASVGMEVDTTKPTAKYCGS